MSALWRPPRPHSRLDHGTPFPAALQKAVIEALRKMSNGQKSRWPCAHPPREDLPEASFAGQQETSSTYAAKTMCCRRCTKFASLFNDRAISYRVHQKFDHNAVALSAVSTHGPQRPGRERRDVHARHRSASVMLYSSPLVRLGETVVQAP